MPFNEKVERQLWATAKRLSAVLYQEAAQAVSLSYANAGALEAPRGPLSSATAKRRESELRPTARLRTRWSREQRTSNQQSRTPDNVPPRLDVVPVNCLLAYPGDRA